MRDRRGGSRGALRRSRLGGVRVIRWIGWPGGSLRSRLEGGAPVLGHVPPRLDGRVRRVGEARAEAGAHLNTRSVITRLIMTEILIMNLGGS